MKEDSNEPLLSLQHRLAPLPPVSVLVPGPQCEGRHLAPPHHQLHLHVLHGAVVQGLQVVTGRSWDGQFVRRSTVTCLTSEGGESHQGRPVNVLARVQVVVHEIVDYHLSVIHVQSSFSKV